jgi:uncharacterized membrane protein YedE/YeeE
MHLDWNAFTPWASLGGGLMIGAATALYVLGVGRIAGIAGIVAGALRSLRGRGAGNAVSWAFLIGLALAPWAWRLVAPLPAIRIDVGVAGLIGAGLLVGLGVRLGNGCTSGHGVCGLSRLSLRSLVNVLAFMAAGALTVFAMRHLAAGV